MIPTPSPGAQQASRAPLTQASIAAIVLLGGAILALMLLQTHLHAGVRPASIPPWPLPPPRSATFDIDVVTLPLAANSGRSWQPSDLETVNAFEQTIRKHASVVMWWADWAHPQPVLEQLEAVGRRGSIPEISWEPWDATRPVTEQPRFRLARIIQGRFDPYIRSWATAIAAYRKPVRLRLAPEMNGRWYPWSESANGNHAHEYVRAWRHVHHIFTAAGASNVRWVWSAAATTVKPALYPGDDYVDMVSLSVYNGGVQLRYTHWRTLSSLIDTQVAALQEIAPGKPIELSEIACAEKGGNKARWITDMFGTLRRYGAITSLIWFDLVKYSDWRVASSPAAAAAFAEAVAGPRYR